MHLGPKDLVGAGAAQQTLTNNIGAQTDKKQIAAIPTVTKNVGTTRMPFRVDTPFKHLGV